MIWEEAKSHFDQMIFPEAHSAIFDHIRLPHYSPEKSYYTNRQGRKDEKHTLESYQGKSRIGGYAILFEYAYCHQCKIVKRQWANLFNDQLRVAYARTWLNLIADQNELGV